MNVARVAMPASGVTSWTVLADDDAPVEPIERYLAYLTDIERSPNTVKAYAHDLKDYFDFLVRRGADWRKVRLEDIGESSWPGCACRQRAETAPWQSCHRWTRR